MSKLLISLFIIMSALPYQQSLASAQHAKPGQVSSTCRYNEGPKLGQVEDLAGKAKPLAIGKPCTDGAGSLGITVLDADDEAEEEAEEAAKIQAAQTAAQNRSLAPQASTCKFFQGKKTGLQESYVGKIQPLPLGSDCTDGLGSIGVIVPD